MLTQSQRRDVAEAALEVEGLLRAGDAITTKRIRALTMSLLRLTPRPAVLRRVTATMIEFVHAKALAQAWAQGDGTRLTGASRLTTALWRSQSDALLRQAEMTEDVLDEQFVVDAGLLDTDRSDPRGLGWLAGTHVRAGLLALWEDGPASGRLQVAGTYDPERLLPELLHTATTPEHFPPHELLDAVHPTDRGVCIVVPVRSRERNWGLLAVVGEINTTSARETYHHWAALLSASLESERLQDAVRRNALYDALTDLPNRRLFLDRLEQSVAQWHRTGTPFAVIFLDLDGFKLINDSLGHQMGDRVLTIVGERINRALRTVDTGARFGGDEFAILLHDVSPLDVQLVTRRIQDTLAEEIDIDGHQLSISASLGVTTSAIEYTSAEDVLHDADTAMYQAKAAERGSVAYFHADMHTSARQQLRLQ